MKNLIKLLGAIICLLSCSALYAQVNLEVEGDAIITDENGETIQLKVSGNNVALELRDIHDTGIYNQPHIDFANDSISDYDARIIFDNYENFTFDAKSHDIQFRAGGADRMRIKPDGRIGIGTSDPLQSLHIANNGNMRIDGSSTTYTLFNTYQGGSGETILQLDPNNTDNTRSSNIRLFRSVDVARAKLIIFRGNNTTQINHVFDSFDGNTFMCALAGSVGIGTTDPLGYRLAVKGNIGAEEIEVRTNYWADFVFEKDYQLRPLKELEAFIQQYGHLPDIPSEEEAISTPLNLGDMDVKLLQKIEELTLYTIEQERKIESQELENKQQNKRDEQQEEMIKKQQELIEKMYHEIQSLKKQIQDEK